MYIHTTCHLVHEDKHIHDKEKADNIDVIGMN